MQFKRTIALILALCLVLSLSACGGGTSNPQQSSSAQAESSEPVSSEEPESSDTSSAEQSGSYPVTITNYDYQGNPVEYTYEKAPERVICVYQCCIEIMAALGLEDHVIASYGQDNEVKDEWKPAFEKMHYDDSVFAPDKETVTMLEPDMIFSWDSYFGEKTWGTCTAGMKRVWPPTSPATAALCRSAPWRTSTATSSTSAGSSVWRIKPRPWWMKSRLRWRIP